MRMLSWVAIAVALMNGTAGTPQRHAGAASEVGEWNRIVFEVTTAAGQNAIIASRAASMAHLAIHDTLNTIERRFETYVNEGAAEPGAAPEAAIAASARAVLADLVPRLPGVSAEERAKATEIHEAAYKAALARVPDGEAKDRGIAAGEAAARAVLLLRSADKSDAPAASAGYAPGSRPGEWRPHPNPNPANPPVEDPAKAAGNRRCCLSGRRSRRSRWRRRGSSACRLLRRSQARRMRATSTR
jgi:hypothetical protein